MFGTLANAVSHCFFFTVEPLLPYKLSNEFGFNERDVGVFLTRFTVAGVVPNFLVLLVPESRVNKIFFIVAGGFFAAFGAFATGPSGLFSLPNKLGVVEATCSKYDREAKNLMIAINVFNFKKHEARKPCDDKKMPSSTDKKFFVLK